MASMLDSLGVRGRQANYNRAAGQVRVDDYEYQIEMDKEKAEDDPQAGQKKAEDDRKRELQEFRADQKARKRTKRAIVQKEPERKISLPSFLAVKGKASEKTAGQTAAEEQQTSSKPGADDAEGTASKEGGEAETTPALAGSSLVGYGSDSSEGEDDEEEQDEKE
mmetsp:Transcript_7471/g.17697  ORF Transcript_7471/g.17697 Transcript_7471/m.17697 type:complete len:165 (-) Transcript_7471:27-521(-)